MASIISSSQLAQGKALVLGASGRLGAMLRGFWPVAGDLVPQGRRALPGGVAFDLLAAPDLAGDAAQSARAVFCLAGVTPAYAAHSGASLSDNRDLALASIEGAARGGAGRVFVISSAAVYGASGGVLREDAVCSPVSDYGVAKLEMEEAALVRAARLGQPVSILRIGNVAGADAILGGWHKSMQIDQLADGTTPRRSYIGPRSLAQALHGLSVCDNVPEILNVALPGAVSMGGLLNAAGLAWRPRPAGPETIAHVELDTSRLTELVELPVEGDICAGLVAEWELHKRRNNG
jgi:UDP-glucose 4-epimerase